MREKFNDILNEIDPNIITDTSGDLIEAGIMDSLKVMTAVAALEQCFEIDFDPDDITPESFATADTIWELVQKYLNEKNA